MMVRLSHHNKTGAMWVSFDVYKYSDKITPHTLRHYFCTIALEGGLSVHEVAYLAGHSNIHTTLIYLNPSREAIRNKIAQL